MASATTARTRLAIVLVVALLAAACGGADDDVEAEPEATASSEQSSTADDATVSGAATAFADSVTVVVANSPGTLGARGRQRVMAALIGDGPNDFLGGPDRPVTLRFSAVDAELTGEAEGDWLTTNASALGLYVASFEFDKAGLWEVTVVADGSEVGGTLIEVVDQSSVPGVGDSAPPTPTPTGSSAAEIAAITTDPEPDADFYDLSLDAAVLNGRPTVAVFATPAFCQTALCGPTIEFVKAAVDGRADLDVVHIEPFDLELAPQGVLEPIPVMADWGLATEPWVFVIDADGIVQASFEGIIGQAELERAIADL